MKTLLCRKYSVSECKVKSDQEFDSLQISKRESQKDDLKERPNPDDGYVSNPEDEELVNQTDAISCSWKTRNQFTQQLPGIH